MPKRLAMLAACCSLHGGSENASFSAYTESHVGSTISVFMEVPVVLWRERLSDIREAHIAGA